MRVLICDDNRDAAGMLGLVLEVAGHVTTLCSRGDECIERARAWRPDVALLDIGLPGASGYAVARAMREMDFGHRVVLIAVTGYGSEKDVQIALDSGFDMHLVKPADPQRILRLLESLEKRRAAGRKG